VKVGGALPSWYWPDDVPRRTAVPEQTMDRAFRYRVPVVADQPAIVSAAGTTTYAALLEAVRRTGRGIHALDPAAAVVAVCEPDFEASLVLLLAGMAAGKQVAMIDPHAPATVIGRHLEQSGAAAVLTATGKDTAGVPAGVPVVAGAGLPQTDMEAPGSGQSDLPAVLIPSGDDVVVHSHFALSAMAVSLMTFVPRLRRIPYVALAPLWSWEGITGALGALLHGSHLISVPRMALDGALPGAAGGYTILRRTDADRLLETGRPPDLLSNLRYLFVSTAYFPRRWRRRAEQVLQRPILPLWGTPEVGPAVAAHPTWFPLEAHGIPLVNVFLEPVDPVRGVISDVPWELLESAEIGVDTPAGMVGFAGGHGVERFRLNKVVRTYTRANVDIVGVVTLLPPGNGVKP
jgi:hypothetical protein